MLLIKNCCVFVEVKESFNEEMVSFIGVVYVDFLFVLKFVERGGEFKDEEIVILCLEIVLVGMDISVIMFEWVLFYLVMD